MVDMQLLIYTAIGAGILALIAIVGSNAGDIVSSISRWNAGMIERGRMQKAKRERLYYVDGMAVRADERTGSRSGSSGSWDLVPGQQHQAEPQEPAISEPAPESFARQLAREDLIIMLAVQRKPDGDYLYSANDITKFVGGAAAAVKNTIANVRGRKETPPTARNLTRPVNGW